MSGVRCRLMIQAVCIGGGLFACLASMSGQELPQACCLGDGCHMLLPTECLQLGGVPQGPGSSCDNPEICLQACCLDGLCFGIWPAGMCAAHGGAPQGPGSQCVPGTPCDQGGCTSDLNCDDGDPCTKDYCDAATGKCFHEPINCDDGDPCTLDFCDPASPDFCVHIAVNCDDGDPCTKDYCDPHTGQCVHEPVDCDDGDFCTIDRCDPATGGCVHIANPECQACCLPDGTCDNLPVSVCKEKGGISQGPGSDCATVTCGQEGVPKFSQPPTPEREDIPSNLWISPNGIQKPNVDVADDFRSDGRPISAVRWWGSYLNEEYVPREFGGFDQPPYQIDGWLISFHLPLVLKQVAGGNPKRPALGLYFAPRGAVRINLTEIVPCDGHKVFEYYVDLSQCCLIQSHPDPRLPATGVDRCPARPNAFAEHHCFWYALNIQAVVGVRWLGGASAVCCERVFSNNVALGDFWGWHATSIEKGIRPAVQTAISLGEPVQSPCPPLSECPPGPRWLYGPWSYVKPVCPFDHRINMAFELLTPVTQVPDPCKPLHLISAVSYKTHGTAGEFGIELPWSPVPPYGIEDRVGGPTKVVLTFNQDIVPGDGSLDIGDEVTTSAGVIDSLLVVDNALTILMHDVPRAACATLTVANGPDGVTSTGGEPLEGVNQISILSLTGDVSGDGKVNTLDLTRVRNAIGGPVVAATFRADVNADGRINVLDMTQVRNNVGAVASCP